MHCIHYDYLVNNYSERAIAVDEFCLMVMVQLVVEVAIVLLQLLLAIPQCASMVARFG